MSCLPTDLQARDMCYHNGEQCVTGNVKWDTKAHVS